VSKVKLNIDENTRLMARLHHSLNGRGISIYNPYFQEMGVNAVYLLFYNQNPKPLFESLRKLNMAGAIPAGFEKDPRIIKYMDELGPVSKKIGRIAVVRQRRGKLTGYYQGGYGIAESVRRMTKFKNKKLVILGAGVVVRGLLALFEIEKDKPKEIEIYNRTLENAERVAKEFSFVDKIGTIKDMESSNGDIFINATDIGIPWNKGKDYKFKKEFISGFSYIADTTFVPLKPQLIKVSEKLGKKVSPGWKMFLYQGKMCLEKILDIKVNEKILAKYIVKDFKTNWV
jgi:shikimate 5-dehydrogenase